MIKIDPAILIIAGEVMVALLAALVATLIYLFNGKKRDRAAAAELQGRLKNNAAKRQEWFESVLASNIENGDADANRELAVSWVEKENQFYNHLVEMYMKRNSSALRGLDKHLHEYTSSYLELVSLMRARIDEEQGAIPEEIKAQLDQLVQEGERLAGVVQTLEQENQRLSSELDAANRDIEQAMREYSVAFRPGSGMTGSAITAAPVAAVAMAAAADAPDESVAAEVVEAAAPGLAEPEPAAALVAEADEPSPEEIGADLEELTSEIMAESGVVAATTEPEVVEEMDLAVFDAVAETEPEPEPAFEAGAVAAAADEWRDNFDERPEADFAATVKGPVIDLADEGEILLPQLNELMASIELPDSSADDGLAGDLLGDDIPVLEESAVADSHDMLDEEGLLAQLEELEEIELPPLSADIIADELADLGEPPAKGKDGFANL